MINEKSILGVVDYSWAACSTCLFADDAGLCTYTNVTFHEALYVDHFNDVHCGLYEEKE